VAKFQTRFYVEGHLILWRHFSSSAEGEQLAVFDAFDETGFLVQTFNVERKKITKREDVLVVAKEKLGLLAAGTEGGNGGGREP
jgi:hypothetical protein